MIISFPLAPVNTKMTESTGPFILQPLCLHSGSWLCHPHSFYLFSTALPRMRRYFLWYLQTIYFKSKDIELHVRHTRTKVNFRLNLAKSIQPHIYGTTPDRSNLQWLDVRNGAKWNNSGWIDLETQSGLQLISSQRGRNIRVGATRSSVSWCAQSWW